MSTVRVLTESELRSAVGLGEAEYAVIESVYPAITSGSAVMPDVMRIDVPDHNGEIDVKAAYLPGHEEIAVKVSAGFFDNPSRGLPSLGGLMLLFDTRTGVPRAALFDNRYLTDLRTALAGAVAARRLARADSRRVGVIGAGTQARLQLEAVTTVLPIERATIWARRSEQARQAAEDLTRRLGIDVRPAGDPATAIRDADVVITATPATKPLIGGDMLGAGMHVTAVGSDAEHKQELAVEVLQRADRVVVDSVAQSRRLGELRSAVEQGREPETVVELGAVIAGDTPGRRSEVDVTVCDLTGTGAQDTAIAGLAYRRCVDAGLGVTIAT